jgi:hypothetical protein
MIENAQPGPSGGSGADREPDLAMLAAALRADTADLDIYAKVLTSTLAEALPPGMVECQRDRSVRDRLAGRPGVVTAIRVRTGEATLELSSGTAGQPQARVVTEVRGVVISRRDVSLPEWSELLAVHLAQRAGQSTDAKAALARLLGL